MTEIEKTLDALNTAVSKIDSDDPHREWLIAQKVNLYTPRLRAAVSRALGY